MHVLWGHPDKTGEFWLVLPGKQRIFQQKYSLIYVLTIKPGKNII